jgi:hypothetical protein
VGLEECRGLCLSVIYFHLQIESLSAQSPAVPFEFVPGSLELLQSLGDDNGEMFLISPVSKV